MWPTGGLVSMICPDTVNPTNTDSLLGFGTISRSSFSCLNMEGNKNKHRYSAQSVPRKMSYDFGSLAYTCSLHIWSCMIKHVFQWQDSTVGPLDHVGPFMCQELLAATMHSHLLEHFPSLYWLNYEQTYADRISAWKNTCKVTKKKANV